jgi:hypothetical protein
VRARGSDAGADVTLGGAVVTPAVGTNFGRAVGHEN